MEKPEPAEYPPFFKNYIDRVPEGNFLHLLKENTEQFISFLRTISSEKHDYSYKPGKWTLKQMILHIIDTERVMSYRALTVSRGDVDALLPGMDENIFAGNADAANRTMERLLHEFLVVREATTLLFQHMTKEQSMFTGNLYGQPVTPRALGSVIIGHIMHHMIVIRERYL
jgi:hypothetical protein